MMSDENKNNDDNLEKQDLSMLNEPEEREFKIGDKLIKKVKIWALSLRDVRNFLHLYFKIAPVLKTDPLKALDESPALVKLMAKSLHCSEDNILNASVSFLIWAIAQILEVSNLDFFTQQVENTLKTVATKLSPLLPESQEDYQEKKDGA